MEVHSTHSKLQMWLVAVLYCWLCLSLTVSATEENSENRLAILNSMDKTELSLGQSLQEALGKAAANTNLFQTYYANYTLSGFGDAEIQADFKKVGSDLMSYVYLENSRLSIFLFDAGHPKEFIVSSQKFTTPDGATVSSEEIQLAFRTAFQEVISSYVAKEYQGLPGAQPEPKTIAEEESYDTQFVAADVKKLYRELASLNDRPFYVGANVGMSRFETLSSSTTSGKSYASTVNIGGLLGYRFYGPFSAELGADFFTHFMLHSEIRSQIPLGQKYIKLSASFGGARFMSQPTENLGYAGTNKIPQGTLVYGPGLGIEIPLLGVNIRAEGRYYLGATTVFLGTYGIVYSL
ncbi:MAG: hypothetical protein ACKOA8_00100 [Deltaproteobacteria bacterium]